MQIILTLILLCFTQYAASWWCGGHMVVAHIARSQMSASTINYVDNVALQFSQATGFRRSQDMDQMACWPDDLVGHRLFSMKGWHYIDSPYSLDGTPVPQGIVQEENVAEVIEQMEAALKNHPSWYILSFSLANLIHFYGDIHQPLHTTEMFSRLFPNGDKGGNAVSVSVENTWTNLHAVWDSVCWQFIHQPRRPLNEAGHEWVDSRAREFLTKYKFSDAQLNAYNPFQFATEGHQAAIKYAYPGASNGTVITPDYLKQCTTVAESKITLAGLRLGRELEYLLKDAATLDKKSVAEKIVAHTANVMRKFKANQ